MISLKDSWRAQRKQRQEAVVQRQQQVYKTLEQFHQARQLKASELREDLRSFQLELQLDTQEFLSQVQQQRSIQAEQLVQQLHSFAQTLREQTAQLIAEKAIDRAAMAQRVAQDLSESHADLSLSVAVLRQNLKLELETIQSTVQRSLQAHHQERIQNRIQQIQILANWTETLQQEVQSYLTELTLLRYDRAHQLQKMLKHDRDRRYVKMNELFQQFSQFRAELKDSCEELHQTVWGNGSGQEVTETKVTGTKVTGRENSTQPLNHNGSGEKQSISTPQPQNTQRSSNIPQSNILQNSTPQNNNTAKQPTKRLASRTARRLTSIQNLKSKGTAISAAQEGANSKVLRTPLPVPTATSLLEEQTEKQVYMHIRQTQGARLTEIETALDINRFQAVDALRILIKKGLVTQRDRTYLIQEEVSL